MGRVLNPALFYSYIFHVGGISDVYFAVVACLYGDVFGLPSLGVRDSPGGFCLDLDPAQVKIFHDGFFSLRNLCIFRYPQKTPFSAHCSIFWNGL